MTLAKMPFIDSEQLDEAYLPPAKYHALQRLIRQRERLMKSITIRKNRTGSIVNGYLPGLRKAFYALSSSLPRSVSRSVRRPTSFVERQSGVIRGICESIREERGPKRFDCFLRPVRLARGSRSREPNERVLPTGLPAATPIGRLVLAWRESCRFPAA